MLPPPTPQSRSDIRTTGTNLRFILDFVVYRFASRKSINRDEPDSSEDTV